MKRLLAPVAFALLLGACAAGAPAETDEGTTSPPASSPTWTPDSTPPGRDGSIGDMDQAMIEALIEQAAAETGVSTEEISVVSADAVTWSDGALGCPEPGMAYTQALVPGYRVVLDVAGEEIHYHAGSTGDFFACDDPQPPAEGGTTDR